MLTEYLNEITIDPTASGTVIMVTTTTASKRKLTQIPRKTMVIVIRRKMFTTVMTTLQISTSATAILKYFRKYDTHRDNDDGCYCANSTDYTTENDYYGNNIDLNNDSNYEDVHDCVGDLYNINNNVEEEEWYTIIAEDYDSEIDAHHYSELHEDLYDYCPAERKVDNYNSRRNDYNVCTKRYKNDKVQYINSREDDYGDYFYDEEHVNDIDEDSEIDTDSEQCENDGDEFVNFTYTGSDGDYNCRDKQCCYESDDECTDDKEYYNGQELDVVHDSDNDDSDIDECRDDHKYDEEPDYDYYSVSEISDRFYDLCEPSEDNSYSGYASDDVYDPYDLYHCAYDDDCCINYSSPLSKQRPCHILIDSD